MKNAIKNYIACNSTPKIIFEVGVLLFVVTLPLSTKMNTLMLWVFFAGSLQYVPLEDRILNFKINRVPIILFVLLYFTFVFTLLYTENISYGLRKLEKGLTLILIPLCILTHNKKDFNVKQIFSALGIGIFILMIICWYSIFQIIAENSRPWEQAKYFFQWVYASFNLVKPVDGHPSYIAVLMFLFLGAIYKGAMFSALRKHKLKMILITIPTLIFLLQLSSRIAMIALFCLVIIYFLKSVTVKNTILVALVVFVLGMLSYQFDFLGRKFDKMVDASGTIKFERYQRWSNILETLNDEDSVFFGVGYGDAPKLYERAYLKGKHYKALSENYNAHNQFIELLTGSGILAVGLFIYLFVLFASKTKLKGIALHFFIAFLLFSISESILERSQGVFMFSFLFSVVYILKQKPTEIETTA
ncbi:MAG: O-antigen ligase [Patiriisocius sp.]|jgi:hypothetical protein